VTTVLGIARQGMVVMAADSVTNVYDRPIRNGAKKIRRLHIGAIGTALLGIAGDGALGALAQAYLKVDGEPMEGQESQGWADALADALTQIAVEHGVVENGRLDGNCILGWNGRLWTICHSQAIPHEDGVAAVGTGEGPAIGALDVLLSQYVDGPPEVLVDAAKIAAEIGINRSVGSATPIQLELLAPQDIIPPASNN
jgi:ATP-dependent protease HslVU (ClpYQ) peptidase subunit